MNLFDDDDALDEEDPFPMETKVELLKLVMTGGIKREDFLKSIKGPEDQKC